MYEESLLDQLRALEEFVGNKIVFQIENRIEICDGFNGPVQINLFYRDHLLRNIYVEARPGDSINERPRFFHVRALNQQSEVLVPFSYYYVPHLYLGSFSHEVTFFVSTIGSKDGSILEICQTQNPLLVSEIFDGFGKVAIANWLCTKEEKEAFERIRREYPRWPALKKQGCVYGEETQAITGNIENLLRGLRPLW